jgi:hypothetical protein
LVGKVTQDSKTYTFTVIDQYVSGKSIEQVRLYLEEDTRVNSDDSYWWSGVGLTMDNPAVTFAEAGTSKADTFGQTVITEAKENYRAFGNHGRDLMDRPSNEALSLQISSIPRIPLPGSVIQTTFQETILTN